MLDTMYDSYGFKSNDKFETLAVLKDFKYAPVKRVAQHYTEIGSFISEAGPERVDLVEPEL